MEGKMADRFKTTLPSHRITPPEIFFDRRRFLSALGLGLLATPTLFCAPQRRARAGSHVGAPASTAGCLPCHAQPGLHAACRDRAPHPDGPRVRCVT